MTVNGITTVRDWICSFFPNEIVSWFESVKCYCPCRTEDTFGAEGWLQQMLLKIGLWPDGLFFSLSAVLNTEWCNSSSNISSSAKVEKQVGERDGCPACYVSTAVVCHCPSSWSFSTWRGSLSTSVIITVPHDFNFIRLSLALVANDLPPTLPLAFDQCWRGFSSGTAPHPSVENSNCYVGRILGLVTWVANK